MGKSYKKARELLILESFLQHAGFVVQEIVPGREPPDFEISIDGRRIGIEITEYFNDYGPKSLQAQETLSDKIVVGAQRLYIDSGAPPAHVHVVLRSGCDMRNIERSVIVQELADYVKFINPEPSNKYECRDLRDGLNRRLWSVFSSIYITGVPEHSYAHWHVGRAGWVHPLRAERLQEIIDRKAKDLDRYLQKYDEVWLLITAGFRPSQSVEAREDFKATEIKSQFNRTFFYKQGSQIIELGV